MDLPTGSFSRQGSTHTSNKNTVLEYPFAYRSRRSPVLCRNGCVASSQTLASSIGLEILRSRGGNAADAAIAMAAALAVTEPCSTGLGGDVFALYYDAKTKSVSCINASGRSPAALTAETVKSYTKSTREISPHMVTVPGAAMGWEDVYMRFGSGKIRFRDLLEPAAKLAEEGFPVAPLTAHFWTAEMKSIEFWHKYRVQEGLVDPQTPMPFTIEETQQPPKTGEIFRNPDLARVLRSLGELGALNGFYNAFPGQAIVKTLQTLGGTMTMDDLIQHWNTYPDPISVQYRNTKLWQIPPNGQGIAGLIALQGLEALEQQMSEDDSPVLDLSSCDEVDRYHAIMEMTRLGFADARKYVSDTDFNQTTKSDEGSVEWLLNEERISKRAKKLYNPTKSTIDGHPDPTSCTVSFQVVDGEGNAISFVNSNYMGFGTGIVPTGTGFSLQNRGFGFDYENPQHPNYINGSKRPYHTIIPGILTYADTNDLYATLSNMGGFMQPQGHVQLTVNLVARGMDPQSAIDEPRFCIADGTYRGRAFLEPGVTVYTEAELFRRGHFLRISADGEHRVIFGKAQVIKRDPKTGVLWAGSDGRSDGCAMGF